LPVLLLAAGGVLLPARARANVEALEVWSEVGARVTPVRRLRFTFTHNTRFAEYGLRRLMPELEVDYRVWGPLRLCVGYRYLWRLNGRDEQSQGHLLHGDVELDLEAHRFEVGFRTRFQWRYVDRFDHGFQDADFRDLWRNRVGAQWTFWKPLGVFATYEHFARLDEGLRHDRFRVTAGLSARVQDWRIELFYLRDMPGDIDLPNVNVVGLSLRWHLDLVGHHRHPDPPVLP
jgi:hypothetical protein